MNPIIVGLDVGTNCVRVASIEPGVPPLLRVFGQVALPTDAVRNGEVSDAFAVTTTIARLWAELGIREQTVRVAVSGPRLITRVVDLPSMDEDELLSAVQQKVSEIVPYPPDDAVFDYQVLGPAPEEVGPLMDRVLVAAAHRGSIERLLDAVEAAGLGVEAVDLVPLALVRSLGREAQAQLTTEAIISFGAGTTTVVVHSAGVPHKLETIGRGGRRLTEALVGEYGGIDAAEAVKRRVGISPVALLVSVGATAAARAADAVAAAPVDTEPLLRAMETGAEEPGLVELLASLAPSELELAAEADAELAQADLIDAVETVDQIADVEAEAVWEIIEPSVQSLMAEITRVFDEYRALPDAQRITRVVITGGGSLLAGLDARLTEALGLPVVTGRPRLGLDVADIGFPPEEYVRLDPYLATPLGIAAGGLSTARRIDLTPMVPIEARPSKAPVMLALVFMLLMLTGMAVLTVVRQGQRVSAERSLADQQVANKALQRQLDNYADTAQRAAETDAVRKQILIQLSYDVSWSRLMQELAVTMPNDAFMTSFQGTSTAPGSTAPGVPALSPGTKVVQGAPSGGITVNAAGLGFPSVAAWLQRVSEVKSLKDTWITSAVRVPTSGGDVVVFAAAANLTEDARSNRYNKEESLGGGTGQ